MKGFLLGALIVILSLTSTVQAQDVLTYGQASEVNMDAARLRIAAKLFADAVKEDKLRGAVLLVSRKGKIVLHEAYGWRDLENKKPMKKDSLFRMASNSKAVTAAGVMALVDNGKIKLDDPICKYFPTFNQGDTAKITVRQLLTHTSGLGVRSIFLSDIIQKSDEHPDAPSLLLEVARFGEIGATTPPGEEYKYCNAGYNTLAGLIEQVTGSYKKYLREKIYSPMGMKDSCNHETDADHSRMSAIFRASGENEWRVGWKPGDEPDYPFPRGSGGMISTAYDYAQFLQMLMNGGSYGGERILSKEIVKQGTNSQREFIEAAGDYGFGWQVNEDGACSHGGSDGTWAWFDPKRQIVGCVFTQTPTARGSAGNPRSQFKQMVTDACSDIPPVQSAEGAGITQNRYDVRANYQRAEDMIQMRDGIEIYTEVYTPKDESQQYTFSATPHTVQAQSVE